MELAEEQAEEQVEDPLDVAVKAVVKQVVDALKDPSELMEQQLVINVKDEDIGLQTPSGISRKTKKLSSSSTERFDLENALRRRFAQKKNADGGAGGESKGIVDSDTEEDVRDREKCRDHSEKVTCFKCIKGVGSSKIKQLSKEGKIFGFC